MAQLLRERNGVDFEVHAAAGGIFSNAVTARLQNYAKLATLFYVQIMRSLVSTSTDVGTLIRRPDTAGTIRLGVAERLIGERLAPDAFEEKLPKLPGIT